MTASVEVIEPGLRIEQYEVIQYLGQGVTAHVYKAYDHVREGVVALKKLHANREGIGNRILSHEAQVGGLVHHPGVIATYDFAAKSSGVTLSMEYAEGESLAARIASGRVAEDEVTSIGEQLSSILGGLRAAQVIHRDIVPQNLIYQNGEIKLCDFGAACTTEESADWRLPRLAYRWLRQNVFDSPGFIGSRKAFPPTYLLGAKPTYHVDAYAAQRVVAELMQATAPGSQPHPERAIA